MAIEHQQETIAPPDPWPGWSEHPSQTPFARRLRAWCVQEHYSYRDVARAIGVSRQSVYKWLNLDFHPSLLMPAPLRALAVLTGIPKREWVALITQGKAEREVAGYRRGRPLESFGAPAPPRRTDRHGDPAPPMRHAADLEAETWARYIQHALEVLPPGDRPGFIRQVRAVLTGYEDPMQAHIAGEFVVDDREAESRAEQAARDSGVFVTE